MNWLEPVSTAVTAASLAETLAGTSGKIRRTAERIWNRIRKGRIFIPVFGAGGVGKSTLSLLLSGTDPLDLTPPYEASWAIERQRLTGPIPGTIIVAPGQLEQKERVWPELIKQISAGYAPIIFNVVSYGYHSFSVNSFKELDDFEEGDIAEGVCEKYSQRRRHIEANLFGELLGSLKHIEHPLFIVTIVNKQDLWWEERAEVRDSYQKGTYGQHITSLHDDLGNRIFRHECIPLSSLISNFASPQNEVLKLTSAGYDQNHHLRYLNSFFRKVDEVLKEAGR